MRLPRGSEAVLGISHVEEVDDHRLQVGVRLFGVGALLGVLTVAVVLYVPGFPGVVEATNADGRLGVVVLAPALACMFIGAIFVAKYVTETGSLLVRVGAAAGLIAGGLIYGIGFPVARPLFRAAAGPTPRTLIAVARFGPAGILLLGGGFVLGIRNLYLRPG